MKTDKEMDYGATSLEVWSQIQVAIRWRAKIKNMEQKTNWRDREREREQMCESE